VEGGKIVGSKGAIPFIENLTADHIKRFQEQVELVDIMEAEDTATISAKMNELKARDPGVFPGGPMVVEIKEEGGAGPASSATANPQFLEIESKLDAIEKKLEFVEGEIAQRVGRKVGRDIGILYGIVAGLTAFIIITELLPKLLQILAK
jgi:tetrahydromethanopterin S-methyltransferase subunit A